MQLLTVVESPIFTRHWPDYWSEEEHGEFMAFIASRPDAGDVVPGSGGCRKVRWSGGGKGKRGGVRVIYTTRLANGVVVALVIYGKGATENIPAHVLRLIEKEFGHADE
ncbi:transcriptional regulator [Melaminivora suipulveris]|uniref:Transcriptional regulator n=1 Tax=Melaminivora suipulveris TaxID=2109913 RepID=A0A2R3QAU0_9BURK|nr:transcriptional regulator [Melaminivora suipulveris]AVO48871.1 transcriptional regulator [Melaminivora suipulveris]